MNNPLPTAFTTRMQALLADEFPSFLASYDEPYAHGLRVNPLKLGESQFLALSPFPLEPVEWCSQGFRYAEGDRPGKHPYHAAGLYYLQEPSAMYPAACLEAQPGERILDLCAAPGGKSTQIAAAMRGEGLLVANEPHPARVKALSQNIERLGITNAIVTNEMPEVLAERFPAYFDRILVDAPCSGEGMFRKLMEAIEDWSLDKVAECHRIQLTILEAASTMLKPGGTLVYSTCTFAPLENEQTLVSFLQQHPEFELVPMATVPSIRPGVPAWANPAWPDLIHAARLWPHQLNGEGHFAAKLRKSTDATADTTERRLSRKKGKGNGTHVPKEAISAWNSFVQESLPALDDKYRDDSAFLLFGDQLYYNPQPALDLTGLRVNRTGLHLGTVKKNRLEPAHALALAIPAEAAARVANYQSSDPDLHRYLKGETLARTGENGWTLVTVDGYPLGWGKQAQDQLKNHYPKGLRWLS
ncbi:RsmB/NOP family class I SAM-dependent RNA methyltransferase [Brevibacillus composti]|uniref:RsmB/NOP family class I SAM-dependent RNA methyltransferase n=1 Tax=Brevibacillus composti TaxID=2796470 RepID=A0A7T5EMU7_9BACL|nr:RsmB/NOP family class I SAM-dependent RNA methyltransferase [Brevibacillus composti]QQE75456.1 RsmB/NOP family class I SAM-dependent RNA methyltransferase [Brevibacillus composti]QUO42482.1 RsmB/NOP family class I SAM-dependent RNA methyltransferase [Brevibacillus composti]